MRRKREEKGITLIALIITIIVLLILAGVSIAMLTGENGILKRAEGTEVTQAQAELTEEMQLAIMESLIDRDNAHTIDNVLQIAEANSYISIGNKHTLLEPDPESSLLEVSSISQNANKYVTDECKSVLVVDTDIGVWVKLGQDGSNVTLEQGVGTMNVANLRTLQVVATVGDPDGNKNVTITVEAILEANSSKESSHIEKITGPDGEEITPIETFAGSNGDVNGRVTYEATTNGVYTFTAREANGGTAAGTAIVSESNTAEIEMTSDTEKGEWTDEVNVTIEYDQWTNESLQYKVGTGSWQTAESSTQVVTVTENTTVEARYGTDDTTIVTYTVEEIDNEAPTVPVFTAVNVSMDSFTINIETISTDNLELKEYHVYIDGKKVGTIGANETEYAVQNLTKATTYVVKLVAVDIVGNEKESATVSVTTTSIEIYESATTIEDEQGNEVIIPGGFGISSESGVNITEGIVIEDKKGNQFVWVPVGEGLKKSDGTTQTIKLGRYSTWGLNDSPVELDTVISSYYTESTTGNGNTVATDINGFITEAEKNGGYYIGRYEAGALDSDGKITTNGSTARMKVTQTEAATEAKAMYSASETVESDLINSAAWDTAIMYIQKFSTATTYNATKGNANPSNDTYCKIWNMASGVREWSTETSSYSSSPCVLRAGYSSSSNTTSIRYYNSTSSSYSYIR